MGKTLDRLQYPARLVAGGEVIPNNPRIRGHLAFYDPCEVIVHIERRRRGRSKEQNAYYWAVVLPEISAHTGYTPEELHEIFKTRYLARKRVWRGGEITTVKSTTTLTTNEFAEFLTDVIVEARDLGIDVPEADKAYQFKS